jgi:hypothetical protein
MRLRSRHWNHGWPILTPSSLASLARDTSQPSSYDKAMTGYRRERAGRLARSSRVTSLTTAFTTIRMAMVMRPGAAYRHQRDMARSSPDPAPNTPSYDRRTSAPRTCQIVVRRGPATPTLLSISHGAFNTSSGSIHNFRSRPPLARADSQPSEPCGRALLSTK